MWVGLARPLFSRLHLLNQSFVNFGVEEPCSGQTKSMSAEGLICYFFSLAFLQHFLSLVVTGLSTNDQLSPVLQIGRLKQRETKLQKYRDSCSSAPTPSWNGGSSPSIHCELLQGRLDPRKDF